MSSDHCDEQSHNYNGYNLGPIESPIRSEFVEAGTSAVAINLPLWLDDCSKWNSAQCDGWWLPQFDEVLPMCSEFGLCSTSGNRWIGSRVLYRYRYKRTIRARFYYRARVLCSRVWITGTGAIMVAETIGTREKGKRDWRNKCIIRNNRRTKRAEWRTI